MKRINKLQHNGLITVNESYEAESLEQKMRKVLAGADTVEDTADIIYTPREDGVLPQYDIRTDRFEVAMMAMDKCAKTILARRDEANKQAIQDKMKEIETPVTE